MSIIDRARFHISRENPTIGYNGQGTAPLKGKPIANNNHREKITVVKSF